MNDVTPTGQDGESTHDAAPYQEHGIRPLNISSYPEPSPAPGGDVDPMLAGAQVAITNLTSQVNRAYEELIQRGEQLKRREDAAHERELQADRVLADAERDAQQALSSAQAEAERILEEAHRSEAEAMQRADDEATRVIERARSIEGQMAQRLADLGRREQDLNQRDAQLNETAQRQQAERDWLNEYAQRLTGIAGDLERALGDAESRAGVSAAG